MPYLYGFFLANLKRFKEIIKKARNKFEQTLYKIILIYAIPSFVINLLFTEYIFTSQSPPFDFNLPYIIFFVTWTIIFMLIHFKVIKGEILSSNRSSIELSSSQESSGSHDDIEPALSTLDLIKPRIFEKVRLDEEFMVPSEPLTCPVCGYQNLNVSRICKSCSYNFPSCIICNRVIGGEELVFCPYCNSPYHKLEFFEWLKIKANCPRCNRDLDLWEFQKFLEHEEVEINSSKLCHKCKKIIPKDSDFCIFCGIKI